MSVKTKKMNSSGSKTSATMSPGERDTRLGNSIWPELIGNSYGASGDPWPETSDLGTNAASAKKPASVATTPAKAEDAAKKAVSPTPGSLANFGSESYKASGDPWPEMSSLDVVVRREGPDRYGIYAARDGKVAETRWQNKDNHKEGLGYSVRLSAKMDENQGEDWYGHMEETSVAVKPGDTVKKGDYLGSMSLDPDNRGSADSSHLHFQRMEKDESGNPSYIDPGDVLEAVKGGYYVDKFGAPRKGKPHVGVDIFPSKDSRE